MSQLLPVHVLELGEDGYISQHVDHVEYSGGSIVGLSLLTDALMTLHHVGPHAADTKGEASTAEDHSRPDQAGENAPWLPMLLPRRSLYVLRGAARYEWSHAVPLDRSLWPGPPEEAEGLKTRGRRIAMIFRDRPPGETSNL